MDKMNKYYIVNFNGYVSKKWIVHEGCSIDQIVGNYLKQQNFATTKSERLFVQSKQEVSEQVYRDTETTA